MQVLFLFLINALLPRLDIVLNFPLMVLPHILIASCFNIKRKKERKNSGNKQSKWHLPFAIRPISRFCFRLMGDWKLESLANGKEISAVPFRTKKENYLTSGSLQFPNRFSGKLLFHLTFQPKFPDFQLNGKHPKIPKLDFRKGNEHFHLLVFASSRLFGLDCL